MAVWWMYVPGEGGRGDGRTKRGWELETDKREERALYSPHTSMTEVREMGGWSWSSRESLWRL